MSLTLFKKYMLLKKNVNVSNIQAKLEFHKNL